MLTKNLICLALAICLTFEPLWGSSVLLPDTSQIIKTSWNYYAAHFIAPDGRPLADFDRDDLDDDHNVREQLTVSESAGYALLRAVYLNDRENFDRVWFWTSQNLWRKNIKEVFDWQKKYWAPVPASRRDNLFAWRYSPEIINGKSGVIYYEWAGDGLLWRDGLDAATDADEDIAAALILADRAWGSQEKSEFKNYLKCARLILKDIWEKEVKNIAGRFYLLAGDKYSQINGLNPSYFRMTYYDTIFSEVDSEHPWKALTESSYQILLKCREVQLPDENGRTVKASVNLPPNWLALSADGRVMANGWNKNGYLFGWDAFRVLYQVALHYKTTGASSAASYLTDCFSPSFDFGPNYFLKEELKSRGKILAGYRIDGTATYQEELGAERFGADGSYLAYFFAADDFETAGQIFKSLQKFYHPDGFWGYDPHEYYQQNWAWFGIELTTGGSWALYQCDSEKKLAQK